MPVDERDHLGMMRDQDRWPAFPLLPLKRYVEDENGKRDMQTGYLFGHLSDGDPQSIVYLGNIWSPRKDDDEQVKYDNLEAIVADGWVVD